MMMTRLKMRLIMMTINEKGWSENRSFVAMGHVYYNKMYDMFLPNILFRWNDGLLN